MARVLVTGANRGIGLSFARHFAARGDEVIATARNPSSQLLGLGVRVESLEVTSQDSVNALARRVQAPLDILVNNAGVLLHDGLDAFDAEAVLTQFEVNALGPLRVTAAFQRHLSRGAKVALVTSRMGSIEDNTSGGRYGYRMSKAALNMAGKSLSIDLLPRGIAVVILHPGWVRTEMTGGAGNWGPDECAAALIARIDALTLENTGRFLHASGEPLPW